VFGDLGGLVVDKPLLLDPSKPPPQALACKGVQGSSSAGRPGLSNPNTSLSRSPLWPRLPCGVKGQRPSTDGRSRLISRASEPRHWLLSYVLNHQDSVGVVTDDGETARPGAKEEKGMLKKGSASTARQSHGDWGVRGAPVRGS